MGCWGRAMKLYTITTNLQNANISPAKMMNQPCLYVAD